ncbi:unnamed protein product [Porites evermanni]|uniref:Uncharacterized protein n=1 Tax=Porites evermanni TaxID=104178 RepID=A0ABN8MIL6_9CNID|nr:unnamed protein product [Porites evermanni]
MAEQDSFESLEAENHRLRRTLLVVVSERKKMASQITGVQNLGVQLQKKEQELRSALERIERLESSLARAENRITQLSHLAGNNGQTVAGQGAIVTPGVSKKLLEALTRENTKLRQALDHLTNRGPNGVDLAVENRDLHEIIMTLRDERDMKINEVNELKNLLAAVRDQNTEFLQNQVLRLTAQTTKLERNLNAKQGFLETIVTENETLKTELQTLKDEKITRVQDLKKGLGDLARSQPEVRQIMNQVYDNEDGNSEESTSSQEVNRLKEENNKVREELQTKIEENNHLKEELAKTIEELTVLKEVNEIHNAQQQSHDEERERLLQQLRELQNNLTLLSRESEGKQQQIEELQMEHELMRTALSGYENDFKMERQEKNKALSDHQKIIRERDQAIHSYEQLKKEHIGLRQNIERMYSQAQAQQQAQAAYRRQTSAARTCAAQVQQQQPALRPRGYGMEACADGPGDDFTDSPTSPLKENPKPAPRRYLSQGSQLQCPNCKKLFPHDLLENHMRDCTGDD